MTGPEVVVGGGIVGLSVALELLRRRPGADVVVLEKESGVGLHQSGHNSGVLHSGVYYAPGSLRARLCVEGGRLLRDFCARRGIPVVSRGKVIVATSKPTIAPCAPRRSATDSISSPRALRAVTASTSNATSSAAAGMPTFQASHK